MKKIKNFKITLKPRDLARLYKNFQGPMLAPDQLEAEAQRLVTSYSSVFHPSTVYETFWKDHAPEVLQNHFSGALDGAVAASFLVVSAQNSQELAEPAPWPKVLQESALDEAVHFVTRLLAEEAKTEHCELSSLWRIQEEPLILQLLALLEAAKIGVNPSGSGSASSSYRAAAVGWMTHKRLAKRSC